MNVFFPFRRTENSYFLELEAYFPGTFIFDSFENWNKYKRIDIINIHWPEAIFNFQLPKKREFNSFLETLSSWKKRGVKIVYTVHNLQPHNLKSANLSRLYHEIIKVADGIIHLGSFSLQLFENRHLKCPQSILEHPIFITTPSDISKSQAKKKLKIDENDKLLLVFGDLRSQKEKNIIYQISKRLKNTKFKIFVSKYRIFSPKRYGLLNGVKSSFEDFFSILMNNKIITKDIYGRAIQDDEIQDYFNASEGVILPKVNHLNSGVLFMAYRFNKPVLAPSIGNIKENVFPDGNVLYDPANLSALDNIVPKFLNQLSSCNNYEKSIVKSHPKVVASNYYSFLQMISKS